jgi:ankyrin repeat protein
MSSKKRKEREELEEELASFPSSKKEKKCTAEEEAAQLANEKKQQWKFLFISDDEESLESMQALLKEEVPVDMLIDEKQRLTMLHKVSSYVCLPLVKCLIESGANIEAQTMDGKTPLFFAVAEYQEEDDEKDNECIEVVKYLLSKGANKDHCFFDYDEDGKACKRSIMSFVEDNFSNDARLMALFK